MPKTTDQIAVSVLKRIYMQLLQELPEPTCSREKLKWQWQVEQVKKKVARELAPAGLGITIEI